VSYSIPDMDTTDLSFRLSRRRSALQSVYSQRSNIRPDSCVLQVAVTLLVQL
jgi:hypothetical protein